MKKSQTQALLVSSCCQKHLIFLHHPLLRSPPEFLHQLGILYTSSASTASTFLHLCVVGLPAVVLQLVAASPNLSMSYVPSRILPLAPRIMRQPAATLHCPRLWQAWLLESYHHYCHPFRHHYHRYCHHLCTWWILSTSSSSRSRISSMCSSGWPVAVGEVAEGARPSRCSSGCSQGPGSGTVPITGTWCPPPRRQC